MYASRMRKEEFSGNHENCQQNALDLEGSLVTSSRPPGLCSIYECVNCEYSVNYLCAQNRFSTPRTKINLKYIRNNVFIRSDLVQCKQATPCVLTSYYTAGELHSYNRACK